MPLAIIPTGEAPKANTISNLPRRNGSRQARQQGVQAATSAQEQTNPTAQGAQPQPSFDPRRLTASVLFDARPNARVFAGNFGLTYAVSDNYQIGLLLPVAYLGGAGNRLIATDVTLRNTFVRTFNDNGSFFGVTADTTFGGNAAFRRPNTFLTVSPFLGLHLPDRYDLFVSASWGASVAVTGKLTRAVTDEWNLGLEYSRTLRAAGQLLPFQQQTVLAIAELNRDGRQFSFGLGASIANGATGLAARFGVTQSFR